MTTPRSSAQIRIFGIRKNKVKRGFTFTVRWKVAERIWQETFTTSRLADGFRSDLLAATRRGETFSIDSGRPASLEPTTAEATWFEHTAEFVRMKWPDSAPKYRQSLASSLAGVTLVLVSRDLQPVEVRRLRQYLYRWAFNAQSADDPPPSDLLDAAAWIRTNSVPVSGLSDPVLVRRVLEAIAVNIDGSRASVATEARRRSAFHNCLEYAVELQRLPTNPLNDIKRKRNPHARSIDRRRVANPHQARALLAAVAERDPFLHAFFATMYYAGTRPGEVLNLRPEDCILPTEGWGQLTLHSSFQHSGSGWNNSEVAGEERQLKHRAASDTRVVPAHPQLVKILRHHIETEPIGPHRRLLASTVHDGPAADRKPVSLNTIHRAWRRARQRALSPSEFDSQLALRPYDLRHACLSTWLNAGVPAVQVAEWAGHSLQVLLNVYAKCIDGQAALAMERIESALNVGSTPPALTTSDQNAPTNTPQIPAEPR